MIARVLLFCIAALLCAALHAEEKKDVSFRLYQVGGRKWTMKIMPNAGGDGNLNVNYTVYEVLAVHADYAMISTCRLDEKKKVPKGVEPFEVKIPFKPDLPPFKYEGENFVAQETVKVGSLSFECEIFSAGNPPVRTWRAKRFPGLVVKVESGFGKDELIEFDWFKDDDPAPPPKKGQPKDSPKEETPVEGPDFALFKGKRSWVIHERGLRSAGDTWRKYEVTKVEAEAAELKITDVDESKKPLKGAKPETKRVEFNEKGAEFIAPPGGKLVRTERRKFGSGVLECDVYEAKVEGKAGQVWMAKKYPGLLVRMVLGQGGKDGFAELMDFKE